jgi:hypothetical protein
LHYYLFRNKPIHFDPQAFPTSTTNSSIVPVVSAETFMSDPVPIVHDNNAPTNKPSWFAEVSQKAEVLASNLTTWFNSVQNNINSRFAAPPYRGTNFVNTDRTVAVVENLPAAVADRNVVSTESAAHSIEVESEALGADVQWTSYIADGLKRLSELSTSTVDSLQQAINDVRISIRPPLDPDQAQLVRTIKQLRDLHQAGIDYRGVLSPETLKPEEFLHAQIAEEAYVFYEKPGRERKIIHSQDKNGSVQTFAMDESLSDHRSIVYVNQNHPSEAVLAFRGTVGRWGDLKTDWHIAYGKHASTDRFLTAVEKYLQVSSKYPKITVTGHSLGGSQAIHVAKIMGVRCYAFSPGQGLDPEYPAALNKYPNITTLRIRGDPVSALSGLEYLPQLVEFDVGPRYQDMDFEQPRIGLNFLSEFIVCHTLSQFLLKDFAMVDEYKRFFSPVVRLLPSGESTPLREDD